MGLRDQLVEYVQFRGELRLVFQISDLTDEQRQTLSALLMRLSMLGKRGDFLQWLGQSELADLDANFVAHTGDERIAGGSAVMHYLDDYGSKMTWEKLRTFDKATPDQPTEVGAGALPPEAIQQAINGVREDELTQSSPR